MASSTRPSTDHSRPAISSGLTSTNVHSLSSALHARRPEYTRPRRVKIKIGTWNVAACPGTDKDLGGWFVEGKGISPQFGGIRPAHEREGKSRSRSGSTGQEHVESVSAQEERKKSAKHQKAIPLNDEGAILGGEDIGLYVLGLQEVVELTSAKEYIGRVYADHLGPLAKWKKALGGALPEGYVCVAEQQLSGLLILIYAAPDIAPSISSVSSTSVGTGIMGYLGNKGAVITRVVLGETTRLVFVNCHLASGSDGAHLDRRCWDVSQILQRTKFELISWGGVLDDSKEGIGDEDFAFWFGDLNFRLEGLPGDDIRRLLLLHTKGEYDLGSDARNKTKQMEANDEPIIIHHVDSDDEETEAESEPRTSSTFDDKVNHDDASSTTLPDPDDFVQDPSQDPGSLQATLDSLLPHDQLRLVQKKRKAFHDGWREGPVTFLPTYKYDVGSVGMFDSSEKRRAPSWCDRILYRTRRDKLEYDGKTQDEELVRLKDEEMKARGIDHAGDDEEVLFDYNPEENEDDQPPPKPNNDYNEYNEDEDMQPVITREGYLDKIHLDVYTSHQRVLSSDHKPLDAIFTLEYDAVIPELKAKVQQEVARELDRAENEGRPGITVVVDRSQEVRETQQEDGSLMRQPAKGDEGVDFGEVSYLRRIIRGLTIANTSQVSSTFAFVNRPSDSGDGDRVAPSWLTVRFAGSELDEDKRVSRDLKSEVTLEPGDAVNATLEVFVDDITLVRALNECAIKLDDVLVLRVTDGRDHFVPVHGTWLQSFFGRSIDELIHIPEGGVRALRPRPKGKPGGPVNRGQEVCWSAPRELFKLTEAVETLTERIIADSDMLENAKFPKSPGWPFDERAWLFKDSRERETWRCFALEALDADQNLNESLPAEVTAIEKLEIMSEVLIMFLSSLKDGIIPADLWARVEQELSTQDPKKITSADETKSWVLDVLSTSPNHNISFVFLTSMLQRVVGELAPLPKTGWRKSVVGSAKSSMDSVRRSLSLKSKAPPVPTEPAAERREAVVRAYAEIFAGVLCRGTVPVKERERKLMEERKIEVLEAFLNAGA